MSLALLKKTESDHDESIEAFVLQAALQHQPPSPGVYETGTPSGDRVDTSPFPVTTFAATQKPQAVFTGLSTTSLSTTATAISYDELAMPLWNPGEYGQARVSDEVRLQPPVRQEREVRVRLRFVGREGARVAYDPDIDW